MKILVDMNLSPRWKTIFAEARIEAVHWVDIGPENAPDRVLFEYAARNGYAIVTHDLDFGAILAAGGDSRPSVVQFRGFDLRPEAAATEVIAGLRQTMAELETGAVVTIDTKRTRIRILPL